MGVLECWQMTSEDITPSLHSLFSRYREEFLTNSQLQILRKENFGYKYFVRGSSRVEIVSLYSIRSDGFIKIVAGFSTIA